MIEGYNLLTKTNKPKKDNTMIRSQNTVKNYLLFFFTVKTLKTLEDFFTMFFNNTSFDPKREIPLDEILRKILKMKDTNKKASTVSRTATVRIEVHKILYMNKKKTQNITLQTILDKDGKFITLLIAFFYQYTRIFFFISSLLQSLVFI